MLAPAIIDTDIGYDPDDYFAVLLAFKLPELDVRLFTTADEVGGKRAAFLRRVLDVVHKDVPVVAGIDKGSDQFSADAIIGEAYVEPDRDFVGAMKRVVDSADSVTYVGIGGFSNLAAYLAAHPEDKPKLKAFMMGGAVGYSRHEGWIEHNVKIDVPSARAVVASGVDLSLLMAQTSAIPEYCVNDSCSIFARLETSGKEEHRLLAEHVRTWNRWKGFWTNMHDPLTLASAAGGDFVKWNLSPLSVDPKGNFSVASAGRDIAWSDPVSKHAEFMAFLESALFS